MKWTITKLITAGSFGVLSFVLQLPASSLVTISGVPLAGGIINVFIGPTIDALAALIVVSFGAATVERLVLGLLALPLALGGPPGFFPKLVIMLSQGLVVDLIFLGLKTNKKLASLISAATNAVYTTFALVFVGKIFGVPGIDQTAKIFLSPLILAGTLIAGAIAGFLAWQIYNRVKASSAVVRIQKLS